jgi:hypothetical protein
MNMIDAARTRWRFATGPPKKGHHLSSAAFSFSKELLD